MSMCVKYDTETRNDIQSAEELIYHFFDITLDVQCDHDQKYERYPPARRILLHFFIAARCSFRNELNCWCTHHLMKYSSANHRWYAPPDETSKCEPPVVRVASWVISVRTIGGTRRLMGHISTNHRWYSPPDGTSKCEPPVVRSPQGSYQYEPSVVRAA
ncbi:hypothetical protein AVEN_233835-1 [Araneus ventricosus]|uniref:Uncharacterized protein n=1 Tax=Araneus ventricosus TaxID=182803 RepID=A0A4Y2H3U3_ARAVE|nr:hypothetical protein AVEN_233835-1 [Araneus ventricosus]